MRGFKPGELRIIMSGKLSQEEIVARSLYVDYVGKNSWNRRYFAAWSELPQASKDEWLVKARKRIEYDENDGA